jgi:hypothetical protein
MSPVAARDLVVEPGDRVRTWGQFVSNSDGDWLDLARIDDLLLHPPGWTSGWSIRVAGVDAEQVLTAFADNRNISVVGTWRGDVIEVEQQSPEIPNTAPIPHWTDPPCQPPPGGWPRSVEENPPDLDLGDLESSGAIVTRVAFRPSADQLVVVIAATDIDAIIRQVAPQLPNRLCVIPSRFTREQLAEVRRVLAAHTSDWRLQGYGAGGVDDDAQPFAHAEPFRVTDELADWADTLPEGLLRLCPTLTPA